MYNHTLYRVAERLSVAPSSPARRRYNRAVYLVVTDYCSRVLPPAFAARSWVKNRVGNARCYARRPELLGYNIAAAYRRAAVKLGIRKVEKFDFDDFSEQN